jgi:5'-nucleotidase
MMALTLILDSKPDLVVSGINNGPNLGENIYYSGTVAGAAEGAKYGIPSIAVSVNQRIDIDYVQAAGVAAELAARVLDEGLPAGIALNVNVPQEPHRGFEITHQSHKISRNLMIETLDPYGRPYYWMHEEVPLEAAETGSDYAAVRDGKVSITPLRFDHTAVDLIEPLRKLEGRKIKS